MGRASDLPCSGRACPARFLARFPTATVAKRLFCQATMLKHTRREIIGIAAAAAASSAAQGKQKVTKYVRYRRGSGISYGILDGDSVRELHGDLFGEHKE